MAQIKTALQNITFVDAGAGDGSQLARVEWRIATSGGVTFTIPMEFDVEAGKEEKALRYARAALHHLSRHLADQTLEWAQPD